MGSVSDYHFFHLVSDGGDLFTFRCADYAYRTIEIQLYSSNDIEATNYQVINDFEESGTGPIISSIQSNDGRGGIGFYRREMAMADLPNSGVTAGVYSAVQVNSKGVVTAGNQLIEWGTSGQTTPSANLAVGGLFFMKV